MSSQLRTALALTPLHLALCVFSEGGLITDSLWGDVGHYEGFARRILDGDLPYGDFTVEYPPFALPAFLAPALVTSTAAGYLFAFKLLMAGSIVCALFLKRFTSAAKSWLHFDIYAWTPSAKPGRPEGGECQAARALYALLCARYG